MTSYTSSIETRKKKKQKRVGTKDLSKLPHTQGKTGTHKKGSILLTLINKKKNSGHNCNLLKTQTCTYKYYK